MEVFRHARRREIVDRLWKATACRDPLDRLLACARLECALADAWAALCQDRDADGDAQAAALGLCRLAAADYLTPGSVCAARWLHARARLQRWLPPPVTVLDYSEPEGFLFYGLTPDAYVTPALAWRREHPGRVPWVLALRSIGSTIGAVVASTLDARWTTLRPRGAVDDRMARSTAALSAAVRQWTGDFLVVDEGPGFSGSSLGGVVRWLRRLGVEPARIALLAGWRRQGAGLSNSYAARHWDLWNVYAAATVEAPVAGARWIGGGDWREALDAHRSTPVWPQHERPKFLSPDGRHVWKFAGVGAYGRAAAERARAVARAGFGAPVSGFDAAGGWMQQRRLRVAPFNGDGANWAQNCGRYLAWVESNFRIAAQALPFPALRAMRAANLAELGIEDAGECPSGPIVALDARVAAPEWGVTAEGWVKFDCADHADDPFFPGPADIAWDLAAVRCEFGAVLGAAVVAAYRRHSGAHGAGLRKRLEWHHGAYLAFRVGYCELAAAHTDGRDRAGFSAAARRYRRQLRIRQSP